MTRCLLIDPDALARASLARYLECFAFTVKVGGTAQELQRLALAEPFDVILLDLGVSGMDGLALCRWVREQLGVPLIAMMAADDLAREASRGSSPEASGAALDKVRERIGAGLSRIAFFVVPSSAGGVGPWEYFARVVIVDTFGAPLAAGTAYVLVLHVLLLAPVALTLLGRLLLLPWTPLAPLSTFLCRKTLERQSGRVAASVVGLSAVLATSAQSRRNAMLRSWLACA